MHWEVKRVNDPEGGNTWTDAGIKSPRDILRLMSPGKAKCSCEKAACRWAWTANWNYKGMYQTEYVPQGVEAKGIGEIRPGFTAKKMFPLPYGLTEQEFKFLNLRFPEWYFVCANAGSHDHPVAHTSTKLATRRMLDQLERGTPAEPKLYFDLNGNPSANEAYMARNPGIMIMTFVELITPKDYVRAATKWGPQVTDDGRVRYYTTHIRDIPRDLAEFGPYIEGFISIHTTYYYDSAEIAALLEWARRAKYYGMMHKFDGYSGKLNMGEQEWTKKPSGTQVLITQTNAKTGEAYEHPDNSWWFNHDSYSTGEHGFAWTSGLLCDETYQILATYCPGVACRMSSSCVQIKPMMKTLTHTTARAMTQDQIAASNKVTVRLFGAETSMDIHPKLVPFFGDLRTTVLHKPRTAANFSDHVSRSKIRVKSLMSTSHIDVDAQTLADLTRFSFFIDFEDQYGSDKAMFDQSYARVLLADPLYKKGSGFVMTGTMSMLTDMLMAAADAKTVNQALLKGARAGVHHLNSAKVLATR